MVSATGSSLNNASNYFNKVKNRLQGKYCTGRPVLLRKYKAIYIPVPKVACTSLYNLCAELLHMKLKSTVHDMYFPGFKNLEEINNSHYKEYFKFAFVRNPWDRLVSCYSNKIGDDASVNNRWTRNGISIGLSQYGDAFWAGMSFEEFANTIVTIPDEQAEKHFRSQHTGLLDKEGKLIVDFVGKFETLGEDIDAVCKRLGTEHVKMPHLMRSSRGDYRRYYSDELKEKVTERFSKDIELFRYEW